MNARSGFPSATLGLKLKTGFCFEDFKSRPVNDKLMIKRAYRGKYIFSLPLVLWPGKSRRLRTACYAGAFRNVVTKLKPVAGGICFRANAEGNPFVSNYRFCWRSPDFVILKSGDYNFLTLINTSANNALAKYSAWQTNIDYNSLWALVSARH